ncbi:MAG: molecular chaperone TorD family protein [Chloroflexota bacterium]
METVAEIAAKGQVYKLLSSLYCSPGDGLEDGDSLSSLGDALITLRLDSLHKELERMKSCLTSPESRTQLAVDYVKLFRGPVKAEVYPYESLHTDGEAMGSSTIDVMERYREAGLAVSKDFKDLPDHVSVELEFMHYLCSMQLQCLERKDAAGELQFNLLRGSFLKEHLAKWVPGFADKILTSAASPFYSGLAKVTKEFINEEYTSTLAAHMPDR